MGLGTQGQKYCLILRDDFSSYVWLFPTEKANAEAAAEALVTWISSFGAIEWLVSDQGSHFKNELIEKLSVESNFNHHFTTAYSPWANGTVERVCREVLRASRALCSEWKLGAQDWPGVLETIQSILNHSPLKRLGLQSGKIGTVYRSPLEVFNGRRPRRPLMRATPPTTYEKAFSMDEVRLKQVIEIEKLQESLENMHKHVNEEITKNRKRQVESHNKKTLVTPVNFEIGDFVLVQRAASAGHKLAFKWIGPRKVVKANSNLVFVVEDLITQKRETVHASRLIRYRGADDGREATDAEIQMSKHLEPSFQLVEGLVDIKSENDKILIQVKWEGLPDYNDLTWEPLENISQDVPEILEEYLKTPNKSNLKAKALQILSENSS